MENQPEKFFLSGLAQTLVLEGKLTEAQAFERVEESRRLKISFVQHLLETDKLNPLEIATISSKCFGTPYFDLDAFDKHLLPLDLINEKLIIRHHAMPLYKRNNVIFVAQADPSKQLTLDEIKFHTGLKTKSVVVEFDKLSRLIEEVLNAKEAAAIDTQLDDNTLDDLEISSGEDVPQEDSSDSNDDAPIVRFVNKILLDAIRRGASDIHFEPYEGKYRVRLRIDGILHEVANPPVALGSRIAARIKIISQLDISERRVPQDGRFMMSLSKKNSIDFRVSTCPTTGGEKVVMRILDPHSATLGVDKLGFSEIQKQNFLKTIAEPQGMLLVTGPTGSGKTVTLYTALNMLNSPECNISTAEDPVEIKVVGINQVNINVKTGLTFSSALRSFLRQDPDIIMVGEIRDLETAEIAIKAAQTGHFVLSTLHTNSAPETLTRLVNMGIEPYNIAGSVTMIIAQRLARRLCDKCKAPADIPKEALIAEGFSEDRIPSLTVYKPVGCENCTNGYKGRVGLYEVLVVSKNIGEIIMRNGTSLDIKKAAIEEGMLTIKQSGLEKAAQGITSLDEINRVTKD